MNISEIENKLIASDDSYHCFFDSRSEFEFPVFNEKNNDLDSNEVCPYEIWLINICDQSEKVLSATAPPSHDLNADLKNGNLIKMNEKFQIIEPEIESNEEIEIELASQISLYVEEEDSQNEFCDRIDVVLKKVLRGFRRYYMHGFHEWTNYRNLKKSNLSKEFYTSCLTKYIDIEFNIHDNDKLENILERLIATNRKMPKDKLFEVLFKFNFKELKILAENSQIRFLFNHYIETIDMETIGKAEKLGLDLIIKECNET
jgi:hypothetical protein